MRWSWVVILLLVLGLAKPGSAAPRQYKVYPYDTKPIQTHKELGNEWERNFADWRGRITPEPILRRQLDLISRIAVNEPQWIDGYWLIADAAFQLGNTYYDPRDRGRARALFAKGIATSEQCLKMQPDNPLCKFYLGVNIGKAASIDGIWASMSKAKTVEDLWTSVIESPYDHRFSETASLQGAIRYALGLYYRIVPDISLIKWIFGTKGDLEKSIALHRESLLFDGPNVCNKTMLGVALVCAGGKSFTTHSGEEGLKELNEAIRQPITSALFASCAKDLPRLVTDPGLSCGYETSRQQDTSPEAFQKHEEATKTAH